TSTKPFKTATPLRAMKPIAAGMLKGKPRKYNAKTQPLMANGIPVKTRKLWRTLFDLVDVSCHIPPSEVHHNRLPPLSVVAQDRYDLFHNAEADEFTKRQQTVGPDPDRDLLHLRLIGACRIRHAYVDIVPPVVIDKSQQTQRDMGFNPPLQMV